MNHWVKGMDVSTLLEVETCGGHFFDGGIEKNALEILKDYGTNLVRLRLWNNPYTPEGEAYGAGTNDLAVVMELARRAKRLGMEWMLDFHYSDFWADPGKQTPPKAWQGYDIEQLKKAVYDYTWSVMTVLKEADLLPAIVAVGNEVTKGLLWPLGKVPNYKNIAQLISVGIRAVKAVDRNTSTMIHLDNGGRNDLYREWFDNYFSNEGEDFEYIGLSYYPFWHGSFEQLQHNLNDLAVRYGKDLIVAETSMGFTLEDYKDYEKLSDSERNGMAAKPALASKIEFPMTSLGQSQFMQKLMEIIRDVPNHKGKGFVYWEAAWIPVPGSQWANKAAREYVGETSKGGNEWANQVLFDYDGNALPALKTIRDFQVKC